MFHNRSLFYWCNKSPPFALTQRRRKAKVAVQKIRFSANSITMEWIRMIRRPAIGLVLAALIAGLAAGCQSKKAVELRVAHIYEPLAGPVQKACLKWFEGLGAQFEQAHPGFRVQLEQVKWDKIDSKCMNDFRAGIAHDVVMSSPQLMPQHFNVGDLLDLTPLLQSWPKSQIEDFAWNPSWGTCERDNVRIALPLGVHARAVIYRRDYFEQAGLDPDKPPADLDSLLAAAKKLTRDANGDGRPDVWGLGLYLGRERATIELYFAPLLWHFGGDLYDAKTRKAVFASEAGVRAALWLRDCIQTHKVTPPWAAGEKYDDVIFERFMRGELAMAWGWGNYFNEALEEKGWTKGLLPPTPGGQALKVGVFVTPTRDGAQFANCWAVSIHKLSRHPAEAFEFITTMLELANLDNYADAGLPARKSMWERPQYATPWYRVWRRAAEAGRPMPTTEDYNDLADSVAAALQVIVLQQADPARTLQRYQDEFNRRHAKP